MTGQAGGGRWPSPVQASGVARRPTFPEDLSYREGRRTLRDVAERLEVSLSETVENPGLRVQFFALTRGAIALLLPRS